MFGEASWRALAGCGVANLTPGAPGSGLEACVHAKGIFVEPCHHLYSAGSESPRMPQKYFSVNDGVGRKPHIYIEMAPDMKV